MSLIGVIPGDLTNSQKCANGKEASLTRPQQAFLVKCKEIGWGRLEVELKDGEPVMIHWVRQDIKLD